MSMTVYPGHEKWVTHLPVFTRVAPIFPLCDKFKNTYEEIILTFHIHWNLFVCCTWRYISGFTHMCCFCVIGVWLCQSMWLAFPEWNLRDGLFPPPVYFLVWSFTMKTVKDKINVPLQVLRWAYVPKMGRPSRLQWTDHVFEMANSNLIPI